MGDIGALLVVHRDKTAIIHRDARRLGADQLAVGLAAHGDQKAVEGVGAGRALVVLEGDGQAVLARRHRRHLGLQQDLFIPALDALVAGMTLNIFNKHSDRVKMACIAQLINVLQSVMLTDGDKMIKTPTYYVFHMMRHHQGAALLDSSLVGGATVGSGKNELPKVLESVSEDKDGVITVTLTNNSLESSEDVDIMLTNEGDKYSVSEARYIEGAMDAHNTFEAPEVVDEKDFTAYENTQTGVKVTLPACSVVTLRLSK